MAMPAVTDPPGLLMQVNILARVLRLQEQKLSYDQACGNVSYFFPKENNSLF